MPFLNLFENKSCIKKKVHFNRAIFKTRPRFKRSTHFLHLSQLYMLSPGGRVNSQLLKNASVLRWNSVLLLSSFFLKPLSSSAAKKAARQSSRVTMGPQNQVGMQETTNLSRGTRRRVSLRHSGLFSLFTPTAIARTRTRAWTGVKRRAAKLQV